MPTVPRTGISMGRIRFSRAAALVSASPETFSDQLVIVHSTPTPARMQSPMTKMVGWTTRPTATAPMPRAPKTGQSELPTTAWASGASSRPSTSACASASASRKAAATKPIMARPAAAVTRMTYETWFPTPPFHPIEIGPVSVAPEVYPANTAASIAPMKRPNQSLNPVVSMPIPRPTWRCRCRSRSRHRWRSRHTSRGRPPRRGHGVGWCPGRPAPGGAGAPTRARRRRPSPDASRR